MALGTVLARAGEGTVYEVSGHPEWVAKIFHTDRPDLQSKRDKIAAMIAAPPAGAIQPDGFVVLTWPLHLIDVNGRVGYIMPRIDTSDAVEIHTVSNPSDRAHPLPNAPQWTVNASWLHLLSVAGNLCLAVEAVHDVGAVIGDFQERNILVNDTTRVTLVDCDSMQFADADGRQFLCAVGRPEYSAPELIGVDLSAAQREQSSDLFSLAVHIHQLLMGGNHPFLRGEWTSGGEQPSAPALAAAGDWAGGPGSRLRVHSLAPSVEFLPDEIQRLFIRAFTDGAMNPAARPTAAEWRTALERVQVRDCAREHQIPVAARLCPWCTIDDELVRRKAQVAQAPAPAQKILRAEAPLKRVAPPTPFDSAVAELKPVSGGGSQRPIILGVAAVLVVILAVAGAAVMFWSGGSSSTLRRSAYVPSGLPSEPSRVGNPDAVLGTPRDFVNVALWPFDSPAAADRWVLQSATSGAWQYDAGQTALHFAGDFLGFPEVNRVLGVDDEGDRAHVRVGFARPDGMLAPVANLHLQRIGSADLAPWEVVGTEDDDLTLDSPRYGSSAVGSTLTAGGTITGIDECIAVRVLQPARTLGQASCVMAGGSRSPWSSRVTFSGSQPGPLTVIAWTGGHVADVEKFAITGVYGS